MNLFRWWPGRRRRIAARPLPEAWRAIVKENVPLAARLPEPQLRRLEGITQVMVQDTWWEGCEGLVVTDEMRVTIAAQAALLLVGFEGQYFQQVLTVLIYPKRYLARQTERGPAGVETDSIGIRLGEAWDRGPVILAWPEVLEGNRDPSDGENVVLHEFAHVLDAIAGGFTGTPRLHMGSDYEEWGRTMSSGFQELRLAVRHRRPSVLNYYGATSEVEYFPVATESFFERAAEMQEKLPDVYEQLRRYYRQDPASWSAAGK